MQVRVPTDHMEGTVPVFESKIAANARVHARTHATPYRIPSICSLRCPVPHACKQVLNACPIETMNIVVLLLPLGQRLSTNKWPCHMEAPLVCTIHGANLIINIMPLAPFRPFAIPNENIRRCPRGQRTNPNDQNQKSKPRPGVTMMHHATKRGFKDCPSFLNSTGRLGPKRGRKCDVTPAFSGVPKRRGTKSKVKT